MIKPATLWGLMKSCDDSKWIGEICRALGGQDVELDYGQRQMVNAIKLDSGWMDERMEAQKERWRERKRETRAKNSAEQNSGKCGTIETMETMETMETIETCPTLSNVSQCHVTSVPPSVPPSVRPESKDSLIESVSVGARAQVGLVGHPDCRTVVGAAPLIGVPDWYAKWWWGNCEGSGWVKTNGQPIDNGNWRAVLKAWWNRADAKELERIQNEQKQAVEKVERIFKPSDWNLCQERCEAFKAGSCTCGYKTPPQLLDWPIAPEECKGYRSL